MLERLLLDVVISFVMVVITTTIFYEVLRICWETIPKLKVRIRVKVAFMVLATFAAHTLCIWTYGTLYYLMVEYLYIGSFRGLVPENTDYLAYIYFSAEVYSTLGLGDLIPEGAFRFITGVEALNGLVLIGWGVTYTYFAMEKFWPLHKNIRHDQDEI
jgi:hypothetical protein